METFDIIDNQLCKIKDDEIIHVYEREEGMTRAQYDFMCSKIQALPGCMWHEAESAWDQLTPEVQATLINISDQEYRQAKDICQGLLATLHEYQGYKKVKSAFAEAIKSCEFNFT